MNMVYGLNNHFFLSVLLLSVHSYCVLASTCCSDWIAWRERNPIDESHDDWFFRHEMRDDDSINTQPDYSLDPM